MRLLRLLIVLIILLTSIYWVSAQEDTRDNEPNWCYEGEEWGDGRCNHPDPDINNYNWQIGWLFAQCDLGNLPREVCYQPVEDDIPASSILGFSYQYAFRSIRLVE